MSNKTFIIKSASGSPYEFFKYKQETVVIFENAAGGWTASGFCFQVVGSGKEEVIEKYKAKRDASYDRAN